MTLHRNARTCPRSRRLLADRVLVGGWSLAAAAEAAGVSERTAWKWVDRFRREGEAGLEDRSSAPRVGAVADAGGSGGADRVVARAALHEPGDRGDAGDAALDRRGGAQPARAGKLPRLQPDEPANSYERPRPGELVHIDVKKLGRIGRPGHRVNSDRTHPQPRDRLGVRARRRRRRDPARLRRSARRRERPDRRRLPPPRRRLLRPLGDPGRANPDRQRLLLPRDRARARLQRRSASATYAPAPTGRARTGRPSASSAP